MELTREELETIISGAVEKALATVQGGTVENPTPPKQEKSAYQKTESLLWNYKGFLRLVQDKQEQIRQLQECGIPQRSKSIVQWSGVQGGVQEILLPEEELDAYIHTVQASAQKILHVIGMIDAAMATLEGDPYYKILEMRYFEGKTQEDIALELGCSQVTISKNKSRLVNELALQLFPGQIIDDLLA